MFSLHGKKEPFLLKAIACFPVPVVERPPLKASRVGSMLQLTRYETKLFIYLVIHKVFPLLNRQHHKCYGFNFHFKATEITNIKKLLGNTLITSVERKFLNPVRHWRRNLKALSLLPVPVTMMKICLFPKHLSPLCLQVSVKTDVPAVSNDYTVAWMSALPEV